MPILAIVTPKPSGATQQFVPQRLPHSNTFDRTIIEPLLATQTTLQPNHASLTRQNQFSTAANDIEKILLVNFCSYKHPTYKILLSSNDSKQPSIVYVNINNVITEYQ